MKNSLFAFLILTVSIGFPSLQINAQEQDKNSDYLKIFKTADDIMDGVWNLDPNKDAIAIELNNCLEKHGDSFGIDQCTDKAYSSYKLILDRLLKLSKFGSADNQKRWLALQKSDDQIIQEMGKDNLGSIWGPLCGKHKVSMIRERIAEVAFYLGGGQE